MESYGLFQSFLEKNLLAARQNLALLTWDIYIPETGVRVCSLTDEVVRYEFTLFLEKIILEKKFEKLFDLEVRLLQ